MCLWIINHNWCVWLRVPECIHTFIQLNIISVNNITLVPCRYHRVSQSLLGCSQSGTALFTHLIYSSFRLPHTHAHTLKPLTIFNFCSEGPFIFQALSQEEDFSENRKVWGGVFFLLLPQVFSSQSTGVFLDSRYNENMCTGKCSRFVAIALYPLAVLSIICNIVLFFPGGDVKYAKDGHITAEVTYMGGLVGGGVMVGCDSLEKNAQRQSFSELEDLQTKKT